MNAVSPIYDESTIEAENVIALDQPEYAPLIILRLDSPVGQSVITRWELTDDERRIIADGGHIVLSLLHTGLKYPPTCIQVVGKDEKPNLDHLRR